MKFDPKEVTEWFRNPPTGGKGMFEHMLLNAMTKIRKRSVQDDDKLMVDWKEGKCEVQLLWNGVEIPILEVCEEWDKQHDRMLGEMALELVDARIGKIRDLMSETESVIGTMRSELMRKIEEAIGQKVFSEDDWRNSS